MFENLSDRLNGIVNNLRGRGRLSEENIQEALSDVRIALLEADVALPVVKEFTQSIKEKAVGQDVITGINPGQAFIKIVHDELVQLLGNENDSLNLKTQSPAVILMAGLQGSGKTTSVAKLAKLLKERENKSVMVTSADIYRPAAIDQLKTLAAEVNVSFYPSDTSQSPIKIAQEALNAAKKAQSDVVIIDTAGRLHIDNQMMDEIQAIHAAVNPIETLFVVDSMTGQDAANTAKAFNDHLALTGVILTKTDGDARGGAALSIRQITGKPIKFLGTGEKIEALEPFYPDRLASRILGMGDVLSLVEEAERKLDEKDQKRSEKLAKKLKKGLGFDLEDFRDQLLQMNKLGGLSGLLDKMPGIGMIPKAAKEQMSNMSFGPWIAIINSMTFRERRFPHIIKGSHKRRIAQGSGTEIQEVNKLLKQFTKMQKMSKKIAKPGAMKKMMRNMPGGGFPGGGFPGGGMPF